jgi:glycosyltransferase involved in cell wall biosynthesis
VDRISICMPTRNRPQLLKLALESCFHQTAKAHEIIIGDDSNNDATERLINSLASPIRFGVKYLKNPFSYGQANNINNLFSVATGRWIILLHDDDILMPCAISEYLTTIAAHPDVVLVYGRQYVMDFSGKFLKEESGPHNAFFSRTESRMGIQRSIVEAAIDGQVPSNGYMVLRSIASERRFRGPEEVGDACDYDFAIQLALADSHAKACLIPAYTHCYRRTPNSLYSLGRCESFAYQQVQALMAAGIEKAACERALVRLAHRAATDLIVMGNRRDALKIYFSPYYARHRYGLRGLIFWVHFFSPFPAVTKVSIRKFRNFLNVATKKLQHSG